MNIGIDAMPLLNKDGIGRFFTNVLSELQRLDQDNHYFLFSQADFELPFQNDRWQKRIHHRVPYALSYLFFRGASRDPALDVFWATRHTFPVGLLARACKIFTVHDLVWRLYPETMDSVNYSLFQRYVPDAIRRADRIITVSKSTRRALVDAFAIDSKRISILYNAASPCFQPQDRNQAIRYMVGKYGISENYICTVGTIEPRKNHVMLIKAMEILKRRGRLGHQLLIVGRPGWKCESVYETVGRLGLTQSEVRFLGQVPDEDLASVYAGAALFVYPSLYEGFGIPLVEAMACGTPIVASNAPAIPEVAGCAAVLVSPDRPEEFADAISRVLGDTTLQNELIQNGIRRARDFRWEAAAQTMLSTLREISEATRVH
jgi:glycosyltransferase involved in cell wall biosynthesis